MTHPKFEELWQRLTHQVISLNGLDEPAQRLVRSIAEVAYHHGRADGAEDLVAYALSVPKEQPNG